MCPSHTSIVIGMHSYMTVQAKSFALLVQFHDTQPFAVGDPLHKVCSDRSELLASCLRGHSTPATRKSSSSTANPFWLIYSKKILPSYSTRGQL